MPVDWATVAENNRITEQERRDREALEGIQRGNPELAADEAAWLATRRREEQERQEQEQHQAELQAFHKFATEQITQLSKPGHENPRTAAEWDRIRTEVCLGRWPADSWVLKADPATSLKFQGLRVRLAPRPEDGPRQVKIANSMFVWQ